MSQSFHFSELNQKKTASSKLAVVFTKLASSATADSQSANESRNLAMQFFDRVLCLIIH